MRSTLDVDLNGTEADLSIAGSSSCIFLSKYGSNGQLTMLVCSFLSCAPYRPVNRVRTLSRSLSIHVKWTSDW